MPRFQPLITTRFRHAVPAVLAILLLASACSSAPEPRADKASKATKKTSYVAQEPPAEVLANSPCGNPDWAQLPAGAEEKLPQKSDAPNDGSDATKPQGKKSSSTMVYPRIMPCT